MSDHPGFEFWKLHDTEPFPVSDITLHWDDDTGASASASIDVPNAQPTAATVAERYIGITDSTQIWFAIECSTQPNGKVTCEGVLRAKHLHWFPDHHETGPGPQQEIRLNAAELKGGGRKEALGVHGPHCDIFSVTWYQAGGKVTCDAIVHHVRMTPAELIEYRERLQREAELHPHPIPHIDPPDPNPTPTPPPKPDLGPDGG